MKRWHSPTLILTVVLVCALKFAEAAPADDREHRVETGFTIPLSDGSNLNFDINQLMKALGAPGLSLAVIDDYKIAWAKGYGFAELDSKPVTATTLLQAGSISKTVAAAGALVLVQQGKLSLDEDVNKKLVTWKIPEDEFTKIQKVTLRQLLSHSAGMTISGFPGYAAGEPVPTLVQTLNGVNPANMAPIRVEYIPGSEYRYSGGGFTVAQQLMIDVARKPFAQFMREAVLTKIGMSDSTFDQPLPPRLLDASATGYMYGAMLPGKRHVYPELAAAGLSTTPTDLAKFAIEIALSKHGKSNRVLSERVTREMLKPGLRNQGLGLALSDPKSPDEFDKNGGNRGFTAVLIMYADSGKGLIVMSNSEAAARITPFLTAELARVYEWKSNPRPKSSGDVMLIVSSLIGVPAAIEEFRYLKKASLPGYVVNENSMSSFANGLMQSHRTADAIEVLQATAEDYPNNWRTYEALGKAYREAGKKDLATQSYLKSQAIKTPVITASRPSLNGRWDATFNWEGHPHTWVFTFDQRGDTLTGLFDTPKVGQSTTITGTVSGSRVSFQVHENGEPIGQFNGTLEGRQLNLIYDNIEKLPAGTRKATQLPMVALEKRAIPPVPPLRANERVTLNAHEGWIAGVAFSPDGKILASAGHDALIKLWDVASGKELRTLKGHAQWVRFLMFTPDGKFLYSTSEDSTIKLWNVATGEDLGTFTGHTEVVRGIALSKDGKTLMSASWDRTIRFWDVATHKEFKSLKGHTNHIRGLDLSPDGKTLASGGEDKLAILWDVATGQQLFTLNNNSVLHCVLFTPDGKTLLAGGSEGEITLWDVATGKEIAQLVGNPGPVLAMGLTTDGKILAVGNFNKVAELWDLTTRKQILTMGGFEQGVRSVSITGDGKTVAAGSMNIIKLWDISK